MEKDQFIQEANTVIRPKLDGKDFEYLYEDVSDYGGEVLGVTADAIIVPMIERITVTYIPTGKSKVYAAGHGTTFPCEFIEDWKKDYYQA